MGLWAFMFVVALLLPILFLCMGAAFRKGGPKEINSVVGYRTHRSMQSVEAWRFAHQYSGALFQKIGLVSLPLSAAAMLALLFFENGLENGLVCLVALVLLVLQMIALLVPIYFTERELKKRFPL